ncbi:glucoside xylosyltransferase 1, partial [Trichuris trichiura]
STSTTHLTREHATPCKRRSSDQQSPTTPNTLWNVTTTGSYHQANLCSAGKDPHCRLPLPVLLKWSEAFDPGDLLRIWLRASTNLYRIVESSPKATGDAAFCDDIVAISRQAGSSGCVPHEEKENSFWAADCRWPSSKALLRIILIACTTACLAGQTASYNCPFGRIQSDKTLNQHDYKCFEDTVHLAVVVCKERYDEALTMIKSAIMFGVSPMHLHIFTDETRKEHIMNEVEGYIRARAWRKLKMNIYKIQYPQGQETLWAELFKPCSSQRLFIPDILTNVDAVLYVDIDVIFLRPVEDIWQLFKRFTAKQMIGVAPESEEKGTNWYTKFAMHPFLKPYGVNTGVMLMNLTRMRAFSWTTHLYPLLEKYKYNITWGDQDLINILFSEKKDRVFLFTCDWNYRPDHCMYTQLCKSADAKGISILHGSRSYFKLDKQPAFKLTYEIIKNV